MTDATIGTLPPAAKPIKGRSLWQDAWRRLRTNKAAIVSLAVLALIAVACVGVSGYNLYRRWGRADRV